MGRKARILDADIRFGRLVTLGEHKMEGGRGWSLCECDCGEIKWIRTKNLTQGLQTSCNCARREQMETVRSYRKGGINYKGGK
jgi:hypothetical protein